MTDVPGAPTCQTPYVKGAAEHDLSNDEEDKTGSNSDNNSSSNNNSSSDVKSTGEPSGAVDDADHFSSVSSDKGEDEVGTVHGDDIDEDEAGSEAGVMEGVHPGLATYESQRAAVGVMGGGGGAGLEEYARMLEQMQVRLLFVVKYVILRTLFGGVKPECSLYSNPCWPPVANQSIQFYRWWLSAESTAAHGRFVVLPEFVAALAVC